MSSDPHARMASRDPVKLPDIYEATANTVIWLGQDYRILGVNEAFRRFARENGGEGVVASWGPGRSLLECLPEALRTFYRGLYDAAFCGRPAEHEYVCHSPDQFRRFVMRLVPRPDGTVVSEHALLVEVPHPTLVDLSREGVLREYRQPTGLISKCCSCQKLRHPGVQGRWDQVRIAFTEGLLEVSHGICPVCAEQLYPELTLSKAAS